MTDEELLAEAKKRYPVGTIHRIAHLPEHTSTVGSHGHHEVQIYKGTVRTHINLIHSKCTAQGGISSSVCLRYHSTGEIVWAEILSKSKEHNTSTDKKKLLLLNK